MKHVPSTSNLRGRDDRDLAAPDALPNEKEISYERGRLQSRT